MTFIGGSESINSFTMWQKKGPGGHEYMSWGKKSNFILTKSVSPSHTPSSQPLQRNWCKKNKQQSIAWFCRPPRIFLSYAKWQTTRSRISVEEKYTSKCILHDLTFVHGSGASPASSPTPETHCHQERVCSSKLSAPASFWGVPLLWRLPADIGSQASAGLPASRAARRPHRLKYWSCVAKGRCKKNCNFWSQFITSTFVLILDVLILPY